MAGSPSADIARCTGFVGGVLLVAVSERKRLGRKWRPWIGVNGSVGGRLAVAWWRWNAFAAGYHRVSLELFGRLAAGLDLSVLAQFTRVLGVSLVVAWGSVGCLLVFWRWREQDRFEPALLKDLAGPAALLLVALGLGQWALSQPLAERRGSLKIALVQPLYRKRCCGT